MTKHPSLLQPLLLVSLLLLASGPLHAAPGEFEWASLNQAIVDQHVLPRYRALADSSDRLAERSRALCEVPQRAQLEQAQQAFHATMDAWQGIQHVQFGPVTFLMRNFSLQYWPDKKNLGGKQLSALLEAQDPATLQAGYFDTASIGVKGLPALERLLFGEAPALASPYACRLGSTIADHVAGMARATLEEWQPLRAEFLQADGSGLYEDNREAATDLMKALVEPVEVIRDLKLLRPMGSSAAQARSRRTESWRSERSLRNIRLNIAALEELYSGAGATSVKALLAAQNPARAEAVDKAFAEVKQQLDSVQGPLHEAIRDPARYARLVQLGVQLKQLHQALEDSMKPLDIQLGFNSRDGD